MILRLVTSTHKEIKKSPQSSSAVMFYHRAFVNCVFSEESISGNLYGSLAKKRPDSVQNEAESQFPLLNRCRQK